MRALRTILTLFVVGCTAAALATAPAQAQQPKAKALETKAGHARGGGPDANIKTDRAPNNPAAAALAAPARKGGEKTRGFASEVHVDNHTTYFIDVYLGGGFCGTVGPWGDIYCDVNTGDVAMYAKAPGTDLIWGPTVNYVDGEFTWRLW